MTETTQTGSDTPRGCAYVMQPAALLLRSLLKFITVLLCRGAHSRQRWLQSHATGHTLIHVHPVQLNPQAYGSGWIIAIYMYIYIYIHT